MTVETRDETGLNLPTETLRSVQLHVARALSDAWDGKANRRTPMSMFTRTSFHQPSSRAEALASARTATRDDVVSAALQFAEALGIERVSWESPDADVTRLWNATADTSGLDGWLREAFHELSTAGVVTTAVWWGPVQHRPSGTGPDGKRARRAKELQLPQRHVILPAERIFRIDTFWGTSKLLWIAEDDQEVARLTSGGDETMRRLIDRPFTPTNSEATQLANAGVVAEHCLLLRSDAVFQVKLPGQDYGNGAVTPMTPVLPWLEQKARLMDSDRASLIGSANYILVIRMGDETKPATDDEADMVKEGLTKIAKMPFIIGDHRMQVDILTPDTAGVLSSDKHAVINARISAATLGLPDTAILPDKIDLEVAARMAVARIKARRHMLAVGARAHLALVAARLNDTPVEEAPSISFMPREIPLIGVTAAMNAALAARARRDLSRHSYLEIIGFDHDVERERIKDEADSGADEDFQTHQPFDTPNNNGGTPPGAMGPTGGRPTGNKAGKGDAKPKEGGAA